jgi:hypothetical protein
MNNIHATNAVFEHLQKLIGLETPLTVQEYPRIEGMNEDQKHHFFIKHSLEHASMTLGKLNEVMHEADHGGQLDTAELKQKTVSMFFTLFKLSFVIGVSGTKFTRELDQMLHGELSSPMNEADMKALLGNYHEAAKILEEDGIEGIDSAAAIVGPQIALAMLLSQLRIKAGSIKAFPAPREIDEAVNKILLEKK